MAEILKDGRFLLKGRVDSVVKIEEKRVSFTEIENRILQSGFVSDVCVIFMEDKRQYLAAAMVFNSKGKERFNGLEKREINNFWREYLLQYFENTVIPKKWRYPETLPLDAQGKKKKEDIQLLFSGEGTETESSASEGFSKVKNEKIIEKTENTVSLEFSIPGTSPYFDGHFPGFPILPAVAQTELVIRFAARHLGTSIKSLELKRVKFINFVKPDTPLLLKLEKKEKSFSFKITSPKNDIVYSTGTIVLEDK